MKAKLIVEGKEFDIDILDPKLQELIAPKKKTGYERVEKEKEFIFHRGDGNVFVGYDNHNESCNNYFYYANYYSDRTVAENNIRADNLMRQLRRFAVEHRKNEFCWDGKSSKYLIYYNHYHKCLSICSGGEGHQIYGTMYFDTAEEARLAIETFRDELIWYFTEYKDSL